MLNLDAVILNVITVDRGLTPVEVVDRVVKHYRRVLDRCPGLSQGVSFPTHSQIVSMLIELSVSGRLNHYQQREGCCQVPVFRRSA